jgi:hypothetical protein
MISGSGDPAVESFEFQVSSSEDQVELISISDSAR